MWEREGGGLTLYRPDKIRALIRCWRSKDSTLIVAVLAADDGVLVLVANPAVIGECFSEPVGRADEGSFGVDVLCTTSIYVSLHSYWVKEGWTSYISSLLLTCTEAALIKGGRIGIASGRKAGCTYRRGVAGRIVQQKLGDVILSEKWEGPSKEGDEVVFGHDVLRGERGTFIGIILLICQ